MSSDIQRITLHAKARSAITAAARQAMPNEAGGVLIGYREDHTLVVTDALALVTDDATTTRYTRDDVQANEWLKRFLADREPTDPNGYIGEWHSHPQPSPPSDIDMRSIRAIAKDVGGAVGMIVYSPLNDRHTAVAAIKGRFGRIRTGRLRVDVDTGAPRPDALPTGAVDPDGPIFISYRQRDGTASASLLERLLRAAGLVVWRDQADLRAGTTADRLDQALTGGLSGAVLIITPDLVSSTVVRDNELPRLMQLDEDSRFSLAIANEIPNQSSPSKPDYTAPDTLLGLGPTGPLRDKKQSNTRTVEGRLEVVRDLLMHRIEQRRGHVAAHHRTFTIAVQTRPAPSALDVGRADLHLRVTPPDKQDGRLPNPQALDDLRQTLPLTSDAIATSGATSLRIEGGMHHVVAFALGAAFPTTRIGTVEVLDPEGHVWTSEETPDAVTTLELETADIEGVFDHVSTHRARIAVFISITDNSDTTAFTKLIKGRPGYFAAAKLIALKPAGRADRIDHREAAHLSRAIAVQLRRIAASTGRAELHIAFHGPMTIALLVARQLNTLRVVFYEWDDPEADMPQYHPCATIELGTSDGPILRVHDTRPDGRDG